MNRHNLRKAGIAAIVLATASLARATDPVVTFPDLAGATTAATTAINAVLAVVGGTVAFFIGLRVVKWLGKK